RRGRTDACPRRANFDRGDTGDSRDMVRRMSALSSLQAALTAMFEGDEATLGGLLHEAAIVVTPDDSYSGRAAATAAFANREFELADVTVSFAAADDAGNRAWTELTVNGRHVGTLTVGDEELPATGRTISLTGAAVADVVDGSILSLRLYYDG